MKDIIFNFIKFLYFFSLIILLVLYLFPGSLIGYFIYGDFGRQPNLVENPTGTSINHFFCFSYITCLGLTFNLIEKNFFNSLFFLLGLSLLTELLHFFVPNRAFEFNDLFANIGGVLFVFILYIFVKKIRHFLRK